MRYKSCGMTRRIKYTGKIEFSRRQVIEGILGKPYGRNARKTLDLSIEQLATTLFQFDYSFYDREKDETYQEVKGFSLITEYHLTSKKSQADIVHDRCSVTLHDRVVSNLRFGYFKPVILSIVSQIKSDVGRLLYRKLDTQFSHYAKYEISSERFFREHGIQGSEYGYPSRRRRLLERAVEELVGKPTSSGTIIDRYEFLRTADGKDWKLIVRAKKGKSLLGKSYSQPPKEVVDRVEQTKPDKNQSKSKNQRKLEQQSFTFKESEAAPENQPQKASSDNKKTTKSESKTTPLSEKSSESGQVLEHFRAIYFDGNTDFDFNKKDESKASQLIEKYGLEKTKAIITQAKVKTDNDRFHPKTLAGLGKYINDALKAAEEDERQAKASERSIQTQLNQRLESQRFDHQRIHAQSYYEYVEDVLGAMVISLPKEVTEFHEQESTRQAQLEADIESAPPRQQKIKELSLRVFHKPESKASRVVTFFQDKKIPIPDFWRWDREINPESFSEQDIKI